MPSDPLPFELIITHKLPKHFMKFQTPIHDMETPLEYGITMVTILVKRLGCVVFLDSALVPEANMMQQQPPLIPLSGVGCRTPLRYVLRQVFR